VLRVGLTGGIACGKSHVLRRLASRGCLTLDLDALAREATAPGAPALAEIAREFGASVLDARGALDRRALAAIVFADASARARLNRIVHPRVRAAETRWASRHAADPAAVLVTDGALLIESGVHLRFDRLVVVHCRPELQLARLRQRDGLDEAAARARIEAQLPSAEKLAFAHLAIDSSGSPDETDRAADALFAELAALAHAPAADPRPPLERLLGGLVHGPDDGPCGVSPRALLAEGASGLELEALALRLDPPARGPWYRAGAEAGTALPASRLSVALAAWCLRTRGPDPQRLALIAGSVARLVHEDPASRSDACLAALVALERARAEPHAEDVASLARRLLPLACRFGGGEPSGRLEAAWAALAAFPADVAGARSHCARLGGDGATAAALAGIGLAVEGPAAAGWREALAAITPRDLGQGLAE